MSGSLEHRPELGKLLDQIRPGDTLVVWRLDRLGRSIRHLIDQLHALAERGVGFRSLQETIDTTSPGGRLVFHVFAALAEFSVMATSGGAERKRRVGSTRSTLRSRAIAFDKPAAGSSHRALTVQLPARAATLLR